MREIVLDTETTGLDPLNGDRIVEIGCVELLNHIQTGRVFHTYLDPECAMSFAASEISGITDEMLSGKPKFADIAADLLAFLAEDPLVIHNAGFDLSFLNAELGRAGRGGVSAARAIDTLMIARRKFPGAPASLDALCKRFNIDLAERVKHGALLDARLLAEVYLELIGGRQQALLFQGAAEAAEILIDAQIAARVRPAPLTPRLSEAEIAAHAAFIVAELGSEPVWQRFSLAA
ncbi:MAG: DNA polymerase III subunit epsilon [Alphaproteobacteria bacterium]